MTVGDALFRWARAEPEGLAEANVPDFHRLSEMVAAVGRIPRRFSIGPEVQRTLAGVAGASAMQTSFPDDGPLMATARNYMIQRLLAHLFSAQGCEACVCGAEGDPMAILLNGLPFVAHDPSEKPPTKINRLTLITEDVLEVVGELANNPLVYALSGLDAGTINTLVPEVIDYSLDVCLYANAAAQAASILLRRDTNALLKLSSIGSASVAGHVGHVAGHAAGHVTAIALVGLAGPWLILLAPIGGFAGRVAARNLARRARYHLLCRREAANLSHAVRLHCLAARDAINGNIAAADAQASQFRDMHLASSGPVQDGVADWLDRLQYIQDYRRLISDRLHRASIDPAVLDPHGGDPIAGAQESLLTCGRVGLHPANVATTAKEIVDATKALHAKMALTLV